MSSSMQMRGRWSDVRKIGRGVALLLTLVACGRSSGCSGCAADGPPFPEKDRIQSAVQVRLTENGVTFLEQNLEPILAEALPDGLNVCLPGQGGDVPGLVEYGFCQDQCPDGNTGCPLTIGIDSVDLQLLEPATVRATLTFAELTANINIYATPVVDCTISINGAGFPVSMDLDLATPEPTRDLTFSISNPTYQLAALDIQLQGNEGILSPLCDLIDGAINLPVLGDFLLQMLQTFIEGPLLDLLTGFVEDFTCQTCEVTADCPVVGGPLCEGGRCMLDGQCIPAPLGVEGLLDLGDMLSGFSPGLDAKLQYLLTPGSYVGVENAGLSLGVIGGARSEKSRCVPSRPQPPTDVEPPRAVALQGNANPAGTPYEVGIGVSDLFVEHGLWAAFNAGTLCLNVTSDSVEQLTVGTLGVFLRDLSRLTDGAQSLAITLSPQDVPIATFGGNVVVPDPDPENAGQFILEDPLLTLEIPNLWIDFHAFIEGRWTRIFSINADVVVPVGIAFDPGNGIIPVLGDLSQAIQNVEVANGEVMRDDPQALANLLPVLLGPLLPQLAAGLTDPIQLPDIMGYQLDLQEHSIQGIENNTFLGIFANLERLPVEPGQGEQIRYSADTTAEVRSVHAPAPGELVADTPDFWRRAHVRLALGGSDGSADVVPLEYQWRVDGGTWSLFSPATEIAVRSPMLALQGRHEIEVRARRVDDYRSLDLSPAAVDVIIDSLPPTVALAADEETATLQTSDLVTPAQDLRIAYRLGDGDWVAVESTPEGELRLPRDADRDFVVRVVDEAGNVGEARIDTVETALIGRGSHDSRLGEAASGCGGCAVPGRGASPGPFALFALLPLGLAARRRRLGRGGRWLATLLMGLGALIVGCDDTSSSARKIHADTGLGGGTGDAGREMGVIGDPDADLPLGECQDDDDCPDGKVCREVASAMKCVLLTCTEDPSICEGVACDNGRPALCAASGVCECEQPCPDGCPDGQFCCRATYACQPLPEVCKDLVCDPGYEPLVESPGEVNEETCAVDGVKCVCGELHPLEAGSIGRFSDFVVAGEVAYFSAYADTYGDLVVGQYDPATQLFEWSWVDGVPADAPVVAGPSGPRGGVEENGDNVGTDTAIALGTNGSLHIAYRDVTNKALKYALGVPDGAGFQWTLLTLDAEGDAGRWASISVDAHGVPGIAYRVSRRQQEATWISEVRYLLAKNDSPDAAGDWLSPFTIAQSVLDAPCAGTCGRGEACVAATNACAATANNCGGCDDGMACIAASGTCEAVLAQIREGDTYPEGTGLFTSQVRDAAGQPVVAWYDRTFGQLWWARFADAGFAAPVQLAGYGVEARDGDMGTNVDLVLDAAGDAHLCYQDGLTDSLRYLAPELGRDEWVDDGTRNDDGRDWAVHVVGEDCNIRLDPAGNPLIVYQDATAQDLVLARRSPEGAWERRVIRGDEFQYRGAFGFYARARVVDTKLWISTYWWDNQAEDFPDGIEVLFEDL